MVELYTKAEVDTLLAQLKTTLETKIDAISGSSLTPAEKALFVSALDLAKNKL